MGRTPKPWWREDRGAYFATVYGCRINLGTNLKQATDKLKGVLRAPLPSVPVSSDSLAIVLDQFLRWTRDHRADKTYRWYRDFIESLLRMYPTITAAAVTSCHITAWLDQQTTWGPTTKRGAMTAIRRAFNWAMRNAGVPHNPVLHMDRPTANARTETITLAEFKAILRATKDRQFRQFLIFCWDCGCRPQEAKQLAGRHADLEHRRCVLPASEAKGGRKARVLYLSTERAVRAVRRGMGKDRIFLNRRGLPWTAGAVKCRFQRLEAVLGKRYHQYSLRHTWITRKLVAGVDSHVVATLAGHADTKMLDKVYSHVSEDYKFLLEQSRR